MKLLHEDLKQEIVFKEGYINVWVIESKALLNRFVRELMSQFDEHEGGFVLYDGRELLRIKDTVNIITDYFSISPNNKNMKGKIIKILDEIAEGEMLCATQELKSRIQQYLEFLIERTDLNLEYDNAFSVNGLLKLLDVRAEENYGNLLENICAYLKLTVSLLPDQLFVFVNLKQYLDASDIDALYKFVEYEKINVLLIENIITERRDNEKYLILDRDFCVI